MLTTNECKDVTENILGDYEEGDELPAKYLHIASE